MVNERMQFRKQVEQQIQSYADIEESLKSIKGMLHDTNMHLLYIRACLLEQQLNEAVSYIEKILGTVNFNR